MILAGLLNPNFAVEREVMSEEQTPVSALRNHVKPMEGARQALKKTLKLDTPVSSLLQVRPLRIFNCGIRVKC